MLALWPLLLPIAAWSGWCAAKKTTKKQSPNMPDLLSQGYVKGVNYILNEQPDKAIDVFIQMLKVDDDTVETHLALGGLFRRRGEVDRAIRIHQNLIARPQLARSQRVEALMALGKDYMCAGVYDRAERIFKEVVELGGHAEADSLKNLLSIYQQQKSWLKALDVLKKLQQLSGLSHALQLAHCYCELVEEQISAKQYHKASQTLKYAISVDKHLVRVSLLQGKLEYLLGNYRQAIKAYKKVSHQDSDYIPEMIGPLYECYQSLGQADQFQQYLLILLESKPSTSIIFFIAKELRQQQGQEVAIDFVTEQLNKNPSLKGLKRLIEWHLNQAYGKVKLQLSMLHKITEKLLEDKPVYRCQSCGFSGKHLHWNCPSCKQWSTIKPISGIEGE